MSDLPSQVTEAGLLFRDPLLRGDKESLQQIIDWGREQIDLQYPIDHLRAPLNSIKRMRAHQEWDTVIRTAGATLRGEVASMAVRELQFEIERRRQGILAEDAEQRRRRALEFDTKLQQQVYVERADIELRNQITLIERQAALSERAAANASDLLRAERVNETEQQIATLLAEAAINAIGSSTASQMLDVIKAVNGEVVRIRNDASLSNDDRHLQIKIILESLPSVLQSARSGDR